MKIVVVKRRTLLVIAPFCIFVLFILHRRISSSSLLYSSNVRFPDSNSINVAENGIPVPDRANKRTSEEAREVAGKINEKPAKAKESKLSGPILDTAEDDAKTAQRFQNRLKVLRSRCPGWKTSPLRTNWVANKNFLINYPRRILVCAVPKAGSTSWHMIVWAMRRKQAGLDPDTKHYNYSDTVENHHIAERLTTQQGKDLITYVNGDDDMFANTPTEKARRLILIRHPFARLISGWHQKFLPASSYADLLFTRYPKLRTYVRGKDPDHRMAWKDFAEFISDTGISPQSLDYHFTPAVETCKPCQYAYTYILKAESVDRDESWLKRRLNITDINVGRKGVPPGGSLVNENPSDKIKQYMAQLEDSVRRKLYVVYKEDFNTFGYTFDFRTLESGGFE